MVFTYLTGVVCVKAQEDAELLKSVISPLEEEISNLKAQLDEARAANVKVCIHLMIKVKS